MKPNETVPFLATLAPALAVAPPLLIGGAILAGLFWLLSADNDDEPPTETPAPAPAATGTAKPVGQAKPVSKRITREDLAEALEYGARSLTRGEAVAALQARGFRKTAAYKALSPDGKFGSLIEFTPDGLIEWKG